MNALKLPIRTLVVFLFAGLHNALALTSAFTYQGLLSNGGSPANGAYQMTFKLFDSTAAGLQAASTITSNSVTVSNGLFSVTLDFGSNAFAAGADRWLEVAVKKPADASFATLSPRQQLTASPYSLRTLSATSADSLSPLCVQCVTDSQINSVSGSKVSGTVASASTADNITGVVAIANGGTGSSSQNFVDLSTAQPGIGGNKTFTGNVTVNGSLTATLGQTAGTAYGTSALTVAPAAAFTLIPGLTQTVTVPAGYKVYVSTAGGIMTTANTSTGFSMTEVALHIDGGLAGAGNYQRLYAANTGGVLNMNSHWSFDSVQTLSAGSHTFSVRVSGGTSGSAATVSGDSSSVLQGQLTVILIKN